MCSAITASSGSRSKAFACWWNAPPTCSTRPGRKARTSAPKNAGISPPRSPRPRSPPRRNGLELCSRLFEVTGARSTHASLRLDRHWRNLRTQTLHDPVDYKLHELGDWALNQSLPIPTFYS